MKEYRYSLPRKREMASGEQKHWYKPDTTLVKYVLERITSEGPLMAKNFEGERRSSSAKG